MKKYKIIYADPPWLYDNSGIQKSRGMARGSFECMPLDNICNLSIEKIADDDCMLFLWATMPKLIEALKVIEAWGFKYITCAFVWVKQNPSGKGIYSGLGHWVNGNAELCLLGRKGRPIRMAKNIKQIQVFPRGRHSAKPPQIRGEIVKLLGDIPRIELFARKPKDQLFEDESFSGWDVIGNEIDGQDIKKTLENMVK